MRPHLVEIPTIAVIPSGQTAPNTDRAPDFSVEDPARNWFYFQPLTGNRVVAAVSPTELISRVQKLINSSGSLRVREDGVLDQATLAAAAELFRDGTRWAAAFPDGGTLRQALLAAERSAIMSPRAFTALLLLGLDNTVEPFRALSSNRADFAWLSRGGIALGTNAMLPQVRLPVVQKNNALEKLAPTPVAFVRRHKVPFMVGGGVLAVALIGYGVWRYTREEI